MSKKSIYLVSFVLVLGLVLTNVAGAADPDLIGWWPLNEGSGDTVIDLSGSGNDGNIHNAASGGLGSGGSVWVNDPEHGMVMSFNGNDSSGAYVSTDLIIPFMSLDNDFSWAFWAKQEGDGTGVNQVILGNRYAFDGSDTLEFIKFTPTNFEYYNNDPGYTVTINYDDIPGGVWIHHAGVKDGTTLTYYRNGIETGTSTITFTIQANPFFIGGEASTERWSGWISDVRIYNKALTVPEILGAMEGTGEVWPYASSPNPADGTLHKDTWVNISWRPGGHAVSHDVYLGDNFDDVNDGAEGTFQGNQASTFFVAGFPGFAYPDGLVPGTTYYWRIDEVNDAEPNSPWKGNVWSFSIPPKTAYSAKPADGAELVAPDVKLSWTAGFGAKLHTVYFGDNFDNVNNATGGLPQGTATYTPPGPLKLGKTYYWRVDEFDIIKTYKGEVWSFTTQGAVVSLKPSNDAVDVKQTQILSWSPGDYAASHQVYFGTDKAVVRNANTSSPEYKGTKALGSESYDPGKLLWDATYYWRIDEVNNVNPDSPWIGPVWSFTTANFLIVDDFEDYDAGENQIWYAWKDGLGYGTPGAQPYSPGNGTGSAVGDESTASYTEETIVHGGSQSMPLFYDNSVLKYSEVEKTLTYPRDWTENGVSTLTIWFRGDSANAAETLYVALNGSTVVSHDNPKAAQIDKWTQWNIDLKAFADQGVNLANVNAIALGLGNKKTPQAGGSGTMYFDDIRLYPPPPEPAP